MTSLRLFWVLFWVFVSLLVALLGARVLGLFFWVLAFSGCMLFWAALITVGLWSLA